MKNQIPVSLLLNAMGISKKKIFNSITYNKILLYEKKIFLFESTKKSLKKLNKILNKNKYHLRFHRI